ncbi:acetolactate synthase large subunit [Saccharopolyspora sp. HNM0986]|uniref:acetolactate synthase large subunit n=1 Tax=Saccharopolyspora galaxeae TaxID=2781241 RepID=UPI00190B8BD4|nr:acetolactate synthase large subunit [Saccharopolyspora sp. HNM0986]MBK0866703.1 acetolactate synthase large subunit [Saccharopolyspora sp. HNM0986]
MKGAEGLLSTARAAGVDVCFANPGTTEMPLVEAFDSTPGVRTVLGLSEGVVTGAADGFSRMRGVPAMTLLHLGPGFANGIANLHNARRGRTPLINVVGEHASWHQAADAPLASDIDSLARPVSGWVGRTTSAESAAAEFVAARQAALAERMPATLIAAADHMWSEGGEQADVPQAPEPSTVDAERVEGMAKLLAGQGRPALLLGGAALGAEGLRLASRIAATVGGTVFAERNPARIERGPGIPAVPTLPYFPEDNLAALRDCTHLVLVGTGIPVSFFGYQDQPSVPVPPETQVHTLADTGEDTLAALRALAEATGSGAAELPAHEPAELRAPQGALHAKAIATAIALTQPEHSIIVNEGVSSAAAYPAVAAAAPAHTELDLPGGAIGMGVPLSTGAALACPDRPVIDFQADGSAFYTLQGLWTQAREGLDVTTVICANSRYRILDVELGRAGVQQPGPAADGMTSLGNPGADWVSLAAGFGVPGSHATTGDELRAALQRAHAEPGPHLIEAVMT